VYIKHIERRKSVESKGGTWWGLAGAGGQDGSFGSPGKGEPQDV